MFRAITLSALAVFSASAQVAAPAPAAPVASSSRVEQRFAQLKKDPADLFAFLYRMPKGADLHNHLSGAVYAESFIRAAAKSHACVDKTAMAILRTEAPCAAGQADAATTESDNGLRDALIDSMSMRSFVPTSGRSGHDHFFATFGKFGQMDNGEMVAEVVRRAGDQNESYLELMALSGGGVPVPSDLNIGPNDDFDAVRLKVESDGKLKAFVEAQKRNVDQMDRGRQRLLGCQGEPNSAACRVRVGYVYQVLREATKESVFAQILAGFALATAEPRVVAVNFVQPEDGVTSMRDYHLQMRMVDYAKKVYPTAHITLHAGELAPGLVPPEGLLFHIREAVEIGHAERIGHGVDIMHEKDALGLLREMRDKHIDVEINLTSNDLILGIKGDEHPFNLYRKYGVPLSLSTDDEGVSRGQLTDEYQRAVLTYNLSYKEVKELVRNSIEYSFAPGDSYWVKGSYSHPVSACVAGPANQHCKAYQRNSDKAALQADLEERFTAFEKSVQ
jgi:adenosine deaminase